MNVPVSTPTEIAVRIQRDIDYAEANPDLRTAYQRDPSERARQLLALLATRPPVTDAEVSHATAALLTEAKRLGTIVERHRTLRLAYLAAQPQPSDATPERFQ